MPKLENPKHDEFALLLARGLKQGEAYIKAGYSENKGAASRLAASPKVQDRVEELKKEIAQKVQTAMTTVSEENWESLAEMGLTYEWVARQYQEIYEASMQAGSFSAANTAVQSIHKMVDIEKNASSGDENSKESRISVTDTLALLQGMKEVMSAAPVPDKQAYIDITPENES
jgi:phage terminase small subunit